MFSRHPTHRVKLSLAAVSIFAGSGLAQAGGGGTQEAAPSTVVEPNRSTTELQRLLLEKRQRDAVLLDRIRTQGQEIDAEKSRRLNRLRSINAVVEQRASEQLRGDEAAHDDRAQQRRSQAKSDVHAAMNDLLQEGLSPALQEVVNAPHKRVLGGEGAAKLRAWMAATKQRAEAAEKNDKATVVALAAVAATFIGGPVAGAAVGLGGEAVINGEVSPAGIARMAIALAASSGESTPAKSEPASTSTAVSLPGNPVQVSDVAKVADKAIVAGAALKTLAGDAVAERHEWARHTSQQQQRALELNDANSDLSVAMNPTGECLPQIPAIAGMAPGAQWRTRTVALPVRETTKLSSFNPEAQVAFQRMLDAPWQNSAEVARGMIKHNLQPQALGYGCGAVQFDEYSIQVDRLPPGMTPEGMATLFVGGPNNLVQNRTFDAMNHFHSHGNEPGIVGSLLDIDIAGPDNGSVIVVDQGAGSVTVQTVYSPYGSTHPEFGVRQFGFEPAENGGYRFFTRGVSQARDLGVATLGLPAQRASWKALCEGMANTINHLGGTANGTVQSQRVFVSPQ